MSAAKPVQWPGKAYNADANDLGEPLQLLLRDLRVLEGVTASGELEKADWKGTPDSVQVITAGATALGKYWPAVVAFFGGGGAILTGLKGWGIGTGGSVTERAVLTASAAFLASIVALSIAIMVRADLAGRAAASTAQYRARATIVSALLNSAHYNIPSPPTVPPPASNYLVMTGDGKWYPVKEFKQETKGVIVYLVGRDEPIYMKDVRGITTSRVFDE